MPGSSDASSTTAPAPSPNSTQVSRSLQSTMRVRVSAPITRARRTCPVRTKLLATPSAYTKPEHAALTSNAMQPFAPSRFWIRHAVAGNTMSGVVVPRITMSWSEALTTAAAVLDGVPHGANGETARGFAVGGDAAFTDAGARADPLVAGIDDLLEVGVGADAFRQRAAGGEDACSGQRAIPQLCAQKNAAALSRRRARVCSFVANEVNPRRRRPACPRSPCGRGSSRPW